MCLKEATFVCSSVQSGEQVYRVVAGAVLVLISQTYVPLFTYYSIC